MKNKIVIVEQECSLCGRRFKLVYKPDGYAYLEDPCGCAADFSPINGRSFSEFLEDMEAKGELEWVK